MPYDDKKNGYGPKNGPSHGDRSGGYGKPYEKRDDRSGGYGKPYEKRDGDRPGGYGKPYDRRDDRSGGYNKPYDKRDGDRSGGYGKPCDRRDDRSGGYKKPYEQRDDRPGGYGKPYDRRDDRSGGYKKPYEQRDDRSGGYGKPYDRRDDRFGGYKKPYEQRDDRPGGYGKPYEKRDGDRPGGYGKPYDRRDDRSGGREPVIDPSPSRLPEDELPNIIMGRNAVKEAIKSGRSIDKLWVSAEQDGSLREILSLARDRNLIIHETPRQKLDELCMPFGYGGRTGNHQGIAAFIPGAEYCDISDILEYAREKGEQPFVIILDGIEDPHNLGSIIRSAECAGAHGVIIPKRRSASLTAAAVKASAGAVSYMKVARVSNICGAMERLKDEGLWIAGADTGGTPVYDCDLKGAIGLVIGGEGDGLGRLAKEKCDFLVSVPLRGQLESLNASVAAGILMFEKRRREHGASAAAAKPVR